MEEENAINELLGEALHRGTLHFNNYRKMWFWIPRGEEVDYWNGTCANCMAHSDLNELFLAITNDYLEDTE